MKLGGEGRRQVRWSQNEKKNIGACHKVIDSLRCWAFFTASTKREMQLSSSLSNFPGGPVVKDMPANAEDMGSIPGLGRSHMSQDS